MSRESEHTCHATACSKRVPPSMFMCRQHWFQLPKHMRDAVWMEYVPGQENRMDPTEAYMEVTREAIEYLERKHGIRA